MKNDMKWKKYMSRPYLLRYLFVICSVFFIGLGTTITRISCLGTEAFTSLNYSVSELFKLPLGTVMTSISIVLLILAFFFLKNGLGVGTIIVMVGLGYSADFWGWLIKNVLGYSVDFIGVEHYFLRICFFLTGMIIMVFFTSFYLVADIGMSAYDTVAYMIEKYTGIPFQWARIGSDFVCVCLAFIFSSMKGTQWELLGIGTLIMACGVGPMLNFLIENIARPIIKKICGEV